MWILFTGGAGILFPDYSSVGESSWLGARVLGPVGLTPLSALTVPAHLLYHQIVWGGAGQLSPLRPQPAPLG